MENPWALKQKIGKKLRKGKLGKTRSIGYGFVTKWHDETLGWALPNHLTGRVEQIQDDKTWVQGEKSYLCKITLQLIKDTKGRKITRIVK